MLFRGGGQGFAGRAGDRFSVVEVAMVFGLAGIMTGEELLQADDIRPGRGSFGDAIKRFGDVRLLRGDAPPLDQGDSCTRHDFF